MQRVNPKGIHRRGSKQSQGQRPGATPLPCSQLEKRLTATAGTVAIKPLMFRFVIIRCKNLTLRAFTRKRVRAAASAVHRVRGGRATRCVGAPGSSRNPTASDYAAESDFYLNERRGKGGVNWAWM
ncbi:hypothetical protein GWI33_003339 [Rhynchophorus ferrugineus]|uniref:Uncharacterized protein n=1 Tax=Rhynchophorus ferrugineus TaxID=354439 RepID=A0A834M306_RHYFE|nr:hypothetical protein GWI33_003339 [Rhynchophorus ferrugineus]